MMKLYGLLMASAMLIAAPALADEVPTPRAVLGHDVGEDRYLANYEDAVRYFEALEKSSDKIRLFHTGRTSQGRQLTYAVISSPENVRDFAKYSAIHRRLSDPRTLGETEARELAATSKIIVHIDGGMHSGEVADHQLPLALAYKLLSAKNDAEVDAILKDVILVLWPTLNPDGQDMVVDWYRKNRGTKFETADLPWLYQEYVGHDNNRDGYMLNMPESRAVNTAEQTYAPVIWYSQHQVAPFPARIWMPPFADPISSNISPSMRIWTNAIGTNMMARFQMENKPGAIAQAKYDNWYPGFLDYIHVFRNTISYFTEVAHASATPKTYAVKDFPPNFRDLKAQVMYPDPWQGGEWHLRDSVDYMLTASMSTLETAQKYRESLLFNRYQAGKDMIARYAKSGPFAYVMTADQADPVEAAKLAQLMIDQGLDVQQLSAPAQMGTKRYPAGSWVVRTDQPFAGLITELFEPQKYPDAILNGDGRPADLPFDVTGWTLPMQMGVRVERIEAHPDASALAATQVIDRATAPSGRVAGKGATYAIPRRMNNAYRALNAVLAAGGKAWLGQAPSSDGSANDAAILVQGLSADKMQAIARDYSVPVAASQQLPAGAVRVVAARTAIYRPWGGNIDEGWTRWLLSDYGYAPSSLYNAEVRKGRLSRHFDTIILPDMDGPSEPDGGNTNPVQTKPNSRFKGPLATLMDGLSPEVVPAPYSGGIGESGAAALRDFVRKGGTLVALNKTASAIIDLFDLPVTDALKDVKSDVFFCSGALVEVELAQDQPAVAGMDPKPIVMFERGPAFTVKAGFKGAVLAAYAKNANPLKSGLLLHPEAIQGKAAAIEVRFGKGKIYLYGFRPQWRGQSHAAYKMLFNDLYKTIEK